MFKIGDYVIHDRHGVVLHITNGMEKAVINSQNDCLNNCNVVILGDYNEMMHKNFNL